MKIVIQRVEKAEVKVENKIISQIKRGLFVLVGVGKDDKIEYAKELAEKLVNLRIMADEEKKNLFNPFDKKRYELRQESLGHIWKLKA